MTPEELDAAIGEVIICQIKPRSTQNSHHRKAWENNKYWRVFTIGKSCKLGRYKEIFNDGKRHEDDLDSWLSSYYGGISGLFRSCFDTHVKEYSYNKKFLRRTANRHVRRYEDIGNAGFYRKVFDYAWECW